MIGIKGVPVSERYNGYGQKALGTGVDGQPILVMNSAGTSYVNQKATGREKYNEIQAKLSRGEALTQDEIEFMRKWIGLKSYPSGKLASNANNGNNWSALTKQVNDSLIGGMR